MTAGDSTDPTTLKSRTTREVLLSYVKIDPVSQSVDASGILGKECYNDWLATRQTEPNCAHNAYRDAVKKVLLGSSRVKPFPPAVEADLLYHLRQGRVWPCFADQPNIKTGSRGWQIKGFHEKQDRKSLKRSRPEDGATDSDEASFNPNLATPKSTATCQERYCDTKPDPVSFGESKTLKSHQSLKRMRLASGILQQQLLHEPIDPSDILSLLQGHDFPSSVTNPAWTQLKSFNPVLAATTCQKSCHLVDQLCIPEPLSFDPPRSEFDLSEHNHMIVSSPAKIGFAWDDAPIFEVHDEFFL